jgi:hypothetical protein
MTTANSAKSSDDYDDFLSFVGGGAPLPPPPRNEASPPAPAQAPAAPPTVQANITNGANNIPTKKNGKKKTCTFSVVDIREHERIAGDNPCVSKGVPIAIGWGYIQHPPIPLDTYETHRGQPRNKIEMLIPPDIRIRLLKDEFNISVATINTAMKDALKVKKQREYTVNTDKTNNNVSFTNVFRKLSRKGL